MHGGARPQAGDRAVQAVQRGQQGVAGDGELAGGAGQPRQRFLEAGESRVRDGQARHRRGQGRKVPPFGQEGESREGLQGRASWGSASRSRAAAQALLDGQASHHLEGGEKHRGDGKRDPEGSMVHRDREGARDDTDGGEAQLLQPNGHVVWVVRQAGEPLQLDLDARHLQKCA